MGLDIYALRDPEFVKPIDDDETDRDLHYVHNAEVFKDRADGLPMGLYRAEHQHHGGWSYSGYNRLREQICRAAFGVEPRVVWQDPEAFTGRIFGDLVPLIHFSDCEGAFGPSTSLHIANALEALRGDLVATTEPDEREYALGGLAKLIACFRDAADHDGFAVWS